MPELTDDMYCSQQIVVPPMFPYLLRQYAKAAIRSQPVDLLRWSTAYFRCLSLNLPPPCKPRLEYPIPRDYDGITPGWLRALFYQLHNTSHVGFRVLWDRWIGACLFHPTLIKILCLGAFTDPFAVPFLRFLALCCGFISENLTQTMILICEVLTDEPEGGSAMIQVETFVDLYRYLAGIDASKDQILLNKYFTDDLLGLLDEVAEKPPTPPPPKEKTPDRTPTPEPESVEEEEKRPEESKDIISCPDLDEVVAGIPPDDDDEEDEDAVTKQQSSSTDSEEVAKKAIGWNIEETLEDAPETVDEEQKEGVAEEETKDETMEDTTVLDTEEIKMDSTKDEVTAYLAGIGEQRVEEEEAPSVVLRAVVSEEKEMSGSICIEDYSESMEEEEEVSEIKYEEVFVEAIHGIGGVVPLELVEAVCEYIYKCATTQHGMVMPRNVRHYSCPPLEVFD